MRSVVFECPESEVDKLLDFLQRHITEYIAEEFPDIPVPMTLGLMELRRDVSKDWQK